MLRYFVIGFGAIWNMSGIFRFAMISGSILILLLFSRRLYAVKRSGGSFFEPYHIENEVFYIHNGLAFGRRIIPLREIKRIRINCIQGIKMSGKRYILYIERKDGKTATVSFGKTRKNDKLVSCLKKETGRYHIEIGRGWFD